MRHLITSTKHPKIDQKSLRSIGRYGQSSIDQSLCESGSTFDAGDDGRRKICSCRKEPTQ